MTPLLPVNNFFAAYEGRAVEIATDAQIGKPRAVKPFDRGLTAVWDTGAMGSCVTESLADALGLVQSGETYINGVTGKSLCRTFLASLFLPGKIYIPEIEISDCKGNIGCDILIGMDVITLGDFAVCNKGGITSFSFRYPSVETINFNNPLSYGSNVLKWAKIPPNAPCPCGSGKKYKKCCRDAATWIQAT
ncbi:SEC-C domain-containing protein [Desulfovibrio sp. OttesenSCG-928-M16]|nr:SEC-C domain-containing protein [Desulfovibrio sp. OttesenSCG-928-M16]